jgi:hypothetical protein
MSPTMRVLQGALEPRQRSGLEAAYEHFRLERQGDLVSPAALENYDYLLQPFLGWLASQWPDVRRFDDLKVAVVRAYRAESGHSGVAPTTVTPVLKTRPTGSLCRRCRRRCVSAPTSP